MEQNKVNAPRKPWPDFSRVFAEELATPLKPVDEAEAYAREAAAGAQDTPEAGYDVESTK